MVRSERRGKAFEERSEGGGRKGEKGREAGVAEHEGNKETPVERERTESRTGRATENNPSERTSEHIIIEKEGQRAWTKRRIAEEEEQRARNHTDRETDNGIAASEEDGTAGQRRPKKGTESHVQGERDATSAGAESKREREGGW